MKRIIVKISIVLLLVLTMAGRKDTEVSAKIKTKKITIDLRGGNTAASEPEMVRKAKKVKVKSSKKSVVTVKFKKKRKQIYFKAEKKGTVVVYVSCKMKNGKTKKMKYKVKVIKTKAPTDLERSKKAFAIQNQYRKAKGIKELQWSDEIYEFCRYRLKTSGYDKHVNLGRDMNDYFGGFNVYKDLLFSENMTTGGTASIGTLNSSFVSGRELFKSAILSNAASMILLHNHPSSELQMSQSDRMVTEKMMYASLFLDIEILDHIIVAGRTGDTLSIRETYPEIFDKSTYVNAIVRVADGVEERENSYDAEGLATYELFQIKEGGNGQAYQFMGMDFVKKNKLVVDKADYESVYRGEIKEGETLDTLYEKFNLYHPDDFTGHSMSVSDVIVIEKEHDKTAYYVDSFGFTKVADFLGEKKYHSAETEQVVSRFREKTKQYFRPIEGMTADRIEEDVREYIQMKIRKYHLPIQIREVMVYGSRSRGTEKADSDLDILFEYAGAWREDDIFNLLHEDDFCIGEVKVDINPVTEEQSGDLSQRLIRAEEYMEQELVFGIEDRYIFAQSVDEGYDYTIYEAVNDIVEDLKQKPDTN